MTPKELAAIDAQIRRSYALLNRLLWADVGGYHTEISREYFMADCRVPRFTWRQTMVRLPANEDYEEKN